MPHVLIVKCAAHGDVVRTSHFAAALRRRFAADLRLSWLVAPGAGPLLALNPDIDDLWFDIGQARGFAYDHVFSLEEDAALVAAVSALPTDRITGLISRADGSMGYTPDAAAWFDMSLVSRLGRERADRLKRENTRTHGQIFAGIFGVTDVAFSFHGNPELAREARAWRGDARALIGINPHAGPRWPAKALPPDALYALVRSLASLAVERDGLRIVLLGAGAERLRNIALAREVGSDVVIVPDTEDDVMRFAAIVGALDYLITSDSLALHLALAQSVPFLAFFSPTSAAEIDVGGIGTKLLSTADDYASYRPDADNRSITAERILDLAARHRPELFAARAG
jgi:heptosyltransferase-2